MWRSGRRVAQQLQPQPSRAVAAHLDRNPDQRFAVTLAAAAKIGVAAAEEALVDFDLADERPSLRRHHRTAQLVQDRPRRLGAGDPELALQQQRRDARSVRRDQVGGPEPHGERQLRLMHDRPRCHRRLPATALALPELTAMLRSNLAATARRAGKAIRPARRKQIRPARLLVRKPALELDHRAWKVGTRHPSTVRPAPDGANRISMSPINRSMP